MARRAAAALSLPQPAERAPPSLPPPRSAAAAAPGDDAFVKRALKGAEQQYLNLLDRGVSLIPVTYGSYVSQEPDVDARILALKREFARASASSGDKGFAASSSSPSPSSSAAAAAAAADDGAPSSSGGAVKPLKVMGGLVNEARAARRSCGRRGRRRRTCFASGLRRAARGPRPTRPRTLLPQSTHRRCDTTNGRTRSGG